MPQDNGFPAVFRPQYRARALVVAGGIVIHAINVFIVITVLPSIVQEIGGLPCFAWNTTLHVLASVLAGGFTARILPAIGARAHYRAALALFALGSAICALAPSMPLPPRRPPDPGPGRRLALGAVLAGLADGGPAGARLAAFWLFASFIAAPVAAFVAIRRILALR